MRRAALEASRRSLAFPGPARRRPARAIDILKRPRHRKEERVPPKRCAVGAPPERNPPSDSLSQRIDPQTDRELRSLVDENPARPWKTKRANLPVFPRTVKEAAHRKPTRLPCREAQNDKRQAFIGIRSRIGRSRHPSPPPTCPHRGQLAHAPLKPAAAYPCPVGRRRRTRTPRYFGSFGGICFGGGSEAIVKMIARFKYLLATWTRSSRLTALMRSAKRAS